MGDSLIIPCRQACMKYEHTAERSCTSYNRINDDHFITLKTISMDSKLPVLALVSRMSRVARYILTNLPHRTSSTVIFSRDKGCSCIHFQYRYHHQPLHQSYETKTAATCNNVNSVSLSSAMHYPGSQPYYCHKSMADN